MLATGLAAVMNFRIPTYVAVRTSKDSLRSIRILVVFPLPLPPLLTGGTLQAVLLCRVSLVGLLGLHFPPFLLSLSALLTLSGEPGL